MTNVYAAIVVGAGHAGCEAAFALANKGHRVALVSLSRDRIAEMPCNPSIGGPAKGIITREIDALGGIQGFYADRSMIQLKMLNGSKGPAVQALRAQIDKKRYSQLIADAIHQHPLITFIEGEVTAIICEKQQVKGVAIRNDLLSTNAVVLTTGTYMDSYVMRGHTKVAAGPDDQKATNALSQSLKSMGVVLQRLKTGTPPRVATSSIDFTQVAQEVIETPTITFSRRSGVKIAHQIACYLTYTNNALHQLIRDNLAKSTMYSGLVNGVGARYCPSIEDKVVRFPDRHRHQVFYEPETAEGDVIYVQGMSTSMPIDIQDKMIRLLPGMANAQVLKWAYAIEYDAINPLQLQPSLMSKAFHGLFFAGQINGTSGYEEAAAQGLMAGINAALMIEKRPPLVLQRDESYIGVLIDDLVTKGTSEPYRMLTSRAEYRLLLRNDNADERLSRYGFDVGLVSAQEWAEVQKKYQAIEAKMKELATIFLSANDALAKKYDAPNGPSLLQLLTRPEVNPRDVDDFLFIDEVTTRIRLAGYIEKQKTAALKMRRLERLVIPLSIDYSLVANLATEARQKLMTIRPQTIGQASRISGINPADIQMIMVYIDRQRKEKDAH